MTQHMKPKGVFRFAPSPSGHMHLGNMASALLNQSLARATEGRLLLRIEDIDQTRCTPELVRDCIEDLDWIGFQYEKPVRIQSQNIGDYHAALDRLQAMGLTYRCSCTRSELKSHVGAHDPEGHSIYPGTCRMPNTKSRAKSGEAFALRLDMAKAMARVGANITWSEKGERVCADPSRWGDVIIGRKDIGVSYHIAVVVDDALQGVTDVVRGRDLFEATSVHRVLQILLDLPEPNYHHHELLCNDDGEKLSKSRQHASIRGLSAQGMRRDDIVARATLKS
jgi:glutamyl-Q tRNA(Asp) synthetase